jgi:hypothetical protein
MAEPVLVGLLLADRIITEDNGKKGVIGTFSRFLAPSFPFAFPPWAIYAAVTNLEGQHEFSLNLAREDDGTVIMPLSGKLQAGSRLDVIEITPSINGLLFPSGGKYVLSFLIDDFPIGARIVFVEHRPQPPAPKEPQRGGGAE